LLSKLARLLEELWFHLRPRRKTQFLLLLCLMGLASIAESISIGAVFPLLSVLTNPDILYQSHLGRLAIEMLGVSSSSEALMPITIFFGISVLISGCIRLLLMWASTRFAFALGADLNIEAYRRTLYQPYEAHIARNTSVVIDGILGKVNGIPYNIIMPTLNLISSSILLTVMLFVLLYIDPIVASISFVTFGAIYFVMGLVVRKKLKANSSKIASESTRVLQLLNEGLGGIREVLIDGNQKLYISLYSAADLILRRSQASNSYIGSSPRIIVETLGIIFITVMAYVLASSGNPGAGGISVIGALALGAQRMLPNLQQIYLSWSLLKGAEKVLEDSLELLNQPMNAQETVGNIELTFNHTLDLNDINFEYQKSARPVLNGLSITIKKGGRIGFVGKTGCGKSTLMDVVMGLLEPSSGGVFVDGTPINRNNRQAWRSHIAHVPQAIFLLDASIAENVAFGVPKNQIDFDRVVEACKQARLDETIVSWPSQYQTNVGERGVRLSGGQRQRIGIARALYKMADVIIFDEATSALDSQTEEEVMRAIENLGSNYTLLIVAHRISTLRICDEIVSLERGQIKSIDTFLEFTKSKDVYT
jgi:ATP-binding cassette, subfamily B, bacterial PglK